MLPDWLRVQQPQGGSSVGCRTLQLPHSTRPPPALGKQPRKDGTPARTPAPPSDAPLSLVQPPPLTSLLALLSGVGQARLAEFQASFPSAARTGCNSQRPLPTGFILVHTRS